ncbi:unnamed protein product, partial [Ectocarpus sp. 12 AP-2014]
PLVGPRCCTWVAGCLSRSRGGGRATRWWRSSLRNRKHRPSKLSVSDRSHRGWGRVLHNRRALASAVSFEYSYWSTTDGHQEWPPGSHRRHADTSTRPETTRQNPIRRLTFRLGIVP